MKRFISILLFSPLLAVAQSNVGQPASITASSVSGSGGGGSGTVTSVSGFNANGASFSIATPTTTPAITLSPTAGGSFASSANNLGFFAATSSAQLLAVMSDETGTGMLVFGTSPTLTTPNIGVATATSISSAALSALLLKTGTFGTAVTFASATGIPTFAGNSIAFSGGSSITDNGSGTVTFNVPTSQTYNFNVNGVNKASLSASGALNVSATTDQSGAGTGAVQVAGGGSVAKSWLVGTQLAFPAATTSATGLIFGTDVNFYRSGTGSVILANPSGEVLLQFNNGASRRGYFSTNATTMDWASNGILRYYTNNGTLALTLDNSQNAILAGSLTTSQTAGIIGTTTNNSANAGSVGEVISSLIAVGSAVSLSNNTSANITSISLTAGDWNVSGMANFSETTSTVTARTAGISSTSATLPTDGSEGYCGVQSTVTSEKNSITVTTVRFSLSGTTTIYLVENAAFSAGSCAGFGSLVARRMR